MLDLFLLPWSLLSVAFVLSIVITIYGLPRGTMPLCLNVKLKWLCSAHRETPWPCTPMDGYRKEEINTSHPQSCPKPGVILQDLWPFYFTSSSPPPLCSIKETSIQTLIRWYSRTLVHHLLWCPAFWIKSLFLASTPRLLIYWPVVWWADWAWIGNSSIVSISHICKLGSEWLITILGHTVHSVTRMQMNTFLTPYLLRMAYQILLKQYILRSLCNIPIIMLCKLTNHFIHSLWINSSY